MSWFKKALKVVLIAIAVVIAIVLAIYLLSFLLVTFVGHGIICTAVATAANSITAFLCTPTFLGCTYGTLCSIVVVAATITGYAVLGDVEISPSMNAGQKTDYIGTPVPSGPGGIDESGNVDEWKEVGDVQEPTEDGWHEIDFGARPGSGVGIGSKEPTATDSSVSPWLPLAACAGLVLIASASQD